MLRTPITVIALTLFTAQASASVVFSSDDPALPITFQGPNTINSTFTIASSLFIQDLNVSMNFNTGFFSELTGTLTSPNGTTVNLFTFDEPAGGIADVTFDDEAASGNLTDVFFNETGSFQPTGSLSAFDNENVIGDWTLSLTDSENFFTTDAEDSNTLNAWSLTVVESPEPGALSLMLLGGGIAAFAAVRRRKASQLSQPTA